MLHLLFKKTSFLFQNDLSHCSASSIVFFSASAVTGVMRYLVLKSNGLRHSKNPPVKFSFSLKIVPATIAKKLPPQRCFKPLLIPIFNFSHKWPTFAFTGESGYTLAFRIKMAHNGSHGETGGISDGGGITTLGVRCVVRNLCARSGQKSILCHLCMDRGNVGEKQRAFGTETRTVRVSVPRRRGPAGSRCSTAVSCAAPVSFAVRYHCDEGQRGKFVNVTVVILFVV